MPNQNRPYSQLIVMPSDTPDGIFQSVHSMDAKHKAFGIKRTNIEHNTPNAYWICYHYLIGIFGENTIGRGINERLPNWPGALIVGMVGTDRFTVEQFATLAKLIDLLTQKNLNLTVIGPEMPFNFDLWLSGDRSPLPQHTISID
jgi:hypothetical protein